VTQVDIVAEGKLPGDASESSYPRESSDNPMLKAFCLVEPSVRFKVRAIVDACLFFFASVFNVRTSAFVHARRFDFLAI
jgi:hypothetical protein